MIKLTKPLPIEVVSDKCEVIDHNHAYDAEYHLPWKDVPEHVINYLADRGVTDDNSRPCVRMAFYVEGDTISDLGFLVHFGDCNADDVQLEDKSGDVRDFIYNNFSEYAALVP
ncbi:hypothetical protein [Paenibacillus antibioticophila]|nr:hypothetical protein [Paenibacillus antibioticophila]